MKYKKNLCMTRIMVNSGMHPLFSTNNQSFLNNNQIFLYLFIIYIFLFESLTQQPSYKLTIQLKLLCATFSHQLCNMLWGYFNTLCSCCIKCTLKFSVQHLNSSLSQNNDRYNIHKSLSSHLKRS